MTKYFIHLLEIEFAVLVISHNLNYFKKSDFAEICGLFSQVQTLSCSYRYNHMWTPQKLIGLICI